MNYSGIQKAVIVYDGEMQFEDSNGIKLVKWDSFIKNGI